VFGISPRLDVNCRHLTRFERDDERRSRVLLALLAQNGEVTFLETHHVSWSIRPALNAPISAAPNGAYWGN
jgi:hypothetical protein